MQVKNPKSPRSLKWLEVNGARLAFHDVGEGLPVLLLHAFPLSSEAFRPQLDALGRRFRLIVPDLRGFGQSGPAGGRTEMSLLARDGLAILGSLGIRRAVVGGVSMGGYAAMALLREDARAVAGLLLADTQAVADDEAGRARREETAAAIAARGTGALVESLLPRLISEDASPAVRGEVEAMIRRADPASCIAAVRGMAIREDSREVLSRFAGPALVVVGEKDVLTPPARARELAALMPGATVREIPGAGHLANLERPDAFNAAAEAFLGAFPASAMGG